MTIDADFGDIGLIRQVKRIGIDHAFDMGPLTSQGHDQPAIRRATLDERTIRGAADGEKLTGVR